MKRREYDRMNMLPCRQSIFIHSHKLGKFQAHDSVHVDASYSGGRVLYYVSMSTVNNYRAKRDRV
jgi:hypothetical protein